jgi:hypothetical protein
MVSQWVFWRQANNFPLDNAITSSSAWRLQSTLDDCVDDRGYWAVTQLSFFSSSDCRKSSKLDTNKAVSAIASSYFNEDSKEWVPYNAFNSDPDTSWSNQDAEDDGGWIIGWDFGQDVTVLCVVLDQRDKKYIVNSVILEARDAEGMWKPVMIAPQLKVGENMIQNTSSDTAAPTSSKPSGMPTITSMPSVSVSVSPSAFPVSVYLPPTAFPAVSLSPSASPTDSIPICVPRAKKCQTSLDCCKKLVCPFDKCVKCKSKKQMCQKHVQCCSRKCNRKKGRCRGGASPQRTRK